MIDHERSLVRKYEGRPFALLGVDEDDNRTTLQKGQKKHKITWRSWWDDGNTIAGQWKVEGFPTLYLIDHKGVIRWHTIGSGGMDKMEQLLEQLIKEAENDGVKQASLNRTQSE